MKKILFIMMVFMLAFGASSSALAGCDKEKCYEVIDNFLQCAEEVKEINFVCKNKYSNDIKKYCNCNEENKDENDAGNIICNFCKENSNYNKCQEIRMHCIF